MKAYQINKFGGPEVFQQTALTDPAPSKGQVLIEVKATSVNPVDYKIRDGRAGGLVPELPATLHPDCSGIVKSIGEDVFNFEVGDEVYCFSSGFAGKPGALADYMIADARMVAHKPENLSFLQAAALPLVAVTAWYCLIDRANITINSSVFVQGGTGGVGHIAVQLAKIMGARVFASCGSDEKCLIAKSLGAEKAFNYNEVSAEVIFANAPSGAGYDIVFNTAGAVSIDHSVEVAAFGATILDILGDFPTKPGFQFKWLNFSSVFAGRSILQNVDQERVGQILNQFAKYCEAGMLMPLIDSKHFSFDEVGAAHTYAEHSKPIGKVVLSNSQ